MLTQICFPGKYIQGAGALTQLPELVSLYGSRGLILASFTAGRKVLPESGLDLDAHRLRVEVFAGECCEAEISRVGERIQETRTDVLVGMGGGKTIDAAKIAADRAGIPVIVVPTIASTDAPCSACAVVYTDNGVFESVAYQTGNPRAVLVDTAVISRAPARFLVAGMGDALATWFEAASCAATRSPNVCGGLPSITGLSIARLCYDTLISYGKAARMAVENQLVTPALGHIVEANTLLSGVGFESGGLAAAHAIHNGLTVLEATHAFYHGEKVAFGVLAGLHLIDAQPDTIDEVYGFCETIGLPTTLSDLGLDHVSEANLVRVAQRACVPEESIHHEAGRITPEMVVCAMRAADAMGRHRRA